MEKVDKNMCLHLQTKTWIKETDDLFDFESKITQTNKFTISGENKFTYIVSKKGELYLYLSPDELKQSLTSKDKIITEVTFNYTKSSFVIKNPFSSENLHHYFEKQNCERPWLVISKENSQEIQEGDVIKMGRIRLKFDKISISNDSPNTNLNSVANIGNNNNNIYSKNNNNANSSILPKDGKYLLNNNNNINNTSNFSYSNNNFYEGQNTSFAKEGKYCCRICYRAESDISDPLISPCKCTGSMGYIHYKCLKSCIESKLVKKEDEYSISYMWKNYTCEICLHDYPKVIQYKNKKYGLIDLDTSKFNEYSIVDYCIYEDNQKKVFHKGIIVIKIDEDNETTVGRTQSNKLRLKDISVSRKHCVFSKKDGKLYITDLSSKFGTLLYLKNGFEIGQEIKKIQMVSGKHWFDFDLKVKWALFSNIFRFGCCSCSRTNEEEFVINLEKEMNNTPNNNNDNNNVVYNEDDSYNDYIMNISKIYLDEEEKETMQLKNPKQKEESSAFN